MLLAEGIRLHQSTENGFIGRHVCSSPPSLNRRGPPGNGLFQILFFRTERSCCMSSSQLAFLLSFSSIYRLEGYTTKDEVVELVFLTYTYS